MAGRPRFTIQQMIGIAVGVLALTGAIVAGTERFVSVEARAEENRVRNEKQDDDHEAYDEILERLTGIQEKQSQESENRKEVVKELCRMGELSEEFCASLVIMP